MNLSGMLTFAQTTCYSPENTKNRNFVFRMIRSAMAYVMASMILLSQAGLPLHLHYCKGILESVSVLFHEGCDNHAGTADLPACCQKGQATHCSKSNDNCCDDQVRILSQDFDSLKPHVLQWTDLAFDVPSCHAPETITPWQEQQYSSLPASAANHGPPKYILYHTLVFYA